MPTTNWYNDNSYRDYPFQTRTIPLTEFDESSASISLVNLPSATIVDFGAIMGIDSGFIESAHHVYLFAIRRQGSKLVFEFRTTAPDSLDESLIFQRDVTDTEFYVDWQESSQPGVWSSSSMSVSSASEDATPDCPTVGKWSGFMVSGKFNELLELLPSDGELLFTSALWRIEQSRIQSLLRGFVKSCNLGNYDRMRVMPALQCNSSSSLTEESPIIVGKQCMTGNLAFKPGYNCGIRQEDVSNTIVISAVKGSGEGEPCEEVPLFAGESPPADSPFLSGGPACNEVLHTVLGKTGRNLQITTGAGLRIAADPGQPNTLRVSTALEDFALCVDNQ